MLHGQHAYGDPFFFVSRVASYRQMLGRSATSLAEALLGYPKALLRAEPELALALLAAIPLLWQRKLPRSLLRPALGALVLLGFLIWGDLRDGAPTHHPERPLLCIWLVGCLVAAVAVTHWFERRRGWLLAALPLVVTASVLRPWYTYRDSFADRRSELSIGRQASQLVRSGRLLIDSGDYGYFAVVAAFEDPRRAVGVVDGDPRQQKLAFPNPAARLQHHLRAASAEWAVIDRAALPGLGDAGSVLAEADRLLLVKIGAGYISSH
jgi:hypothetical protein